MKHPPFTLENHEVDEYWIGRYASLKGATIRLVHRTTGAEVIGEVPQVHHTKTALRAAEDTLRKQLMIQLTEQVAKKLRLAGR